VAKRRLIITAPALDDLRDIRAFTLKRYGREQAEAYGALLKAALRDLRDDPFRPGSWDRPEVGENIRSYHVGLTASRPGSPVRKARHVVLYFLPEEHAVVISRVLHDARDLARHLPERHREDARGKSDEA
tara:strand:- start:689 stop:1078 length:390 start_codon:yes stop_codon:yes gene_type:complete